MPTNSRWDLIQGLKGYSIVYCRRPRHSIRVREVKILARKIMFNFAERTHTSLNLILVEDI